MSHVTWEWVMAHLLGPRGHMNESCHIRMSHCTPVGTMRTYHWCWMGRMPPPPVHVCVTRLIHMRDMTYLYERHDSFTWRTWLIHTWDMTHPQKGRMPPPPVHVCVTRLIHMCDVTHSFGRHDSFIWDSFIRMSYVCLSRPYMYVCDMTYW